MAKYELLEKSFIHERLWDPGEIVEVSDDLVPGPHMIPVDAAAKRAADKVGLVNGPIPDPVDAITRTEAERLAAFPQSVDGGGNGSDPEDAGMPSRLP